jgi:hypothetical protein
MDRFTGHTDRGALLATDVNSIEVKMFGHFARFGKIRVTIIGAVRSFMLAKDRFS